MNWRTSACSRVRTTVASPCPTSSNVSWNSPCAGASGAIYQSTARLPDKSLHRTNYGEFYRLAAYLFRYTKKMIGVALGVPLARVSGSEIVPL